MVEEEVKKKKMNKGKKESLEKKKEEDRVKLIEELKAEISPNLKILRQIKSNPPRGSSSPYERFHFNITVFRAQRDYILHKLREREVTLKDIGSSEEEFKEFYEAAVKADIIVDAPKFGLICVEKEEQ